MANATVSKLSPDEILDAIGNMSVFELAALIETFKTRFNVTIAAAAVGGGAPATAVPGAVGPRPPRSKSRPSSRSCSRRRGPRRSR